MGATGVLKAAVIGLGWWGKQITACLAESRHVRVTHGVDLAAAGLADFARGHGVALGTSFDAVLADRTVDAVIVATPHSQHEAQVLAAIAAGKQVFCEKPLTLTAAGAERILAACDRAGIVLGIGHERRYEPGMEHLARAIKAGELGQLLHLESNMSHNLFARMDPSSWRVRPTDAPAGAMTALGVHVTDLFLSLAGRPTRVQARTGRVMTGAIGEDHVSVSLEFDSGATGTLVCLSTTPYHGRLTVFGTDGWIEVKENANVDQGQPSDVTIADRTARRSTVSYAPANTVLANFDAWAQAVAGQGTYRHTPEQILDNIRILEAIVRSAATGSQPIAL
ncbi:MAG TPA: Gfo/Idh/MocA family oxidoreductase [Burkholderiales bacterium]|nr:Gfo/Idh/MocA family oxidoreductase [Burkholderiales bacterium]